MKIDNLIKLTFCIISFVFISLGCRTDEKSNIQSTNKILKSENDTWVEYLNQKSDSLTSLYTEEAINISENADITIGKNAIKDKLLASQIIPKSIHSDTIILANQKRGLEYEIGGFTDINNQKFKHIIIWETKQSKRKRVFEFIGEYDGTKNMPSDIDARRDLWIEMCNKHNAEALINEMYSKNTIYYNHKPLVIGRDSLTQEYQYMNNEKYELTLKPILATPVNDNLVFEIGQCKGSYNGKYIIIWRKEDSGKWEVFIDSNI